MKPPSWSSLDDCADQAPGRPRSVDPAIPVPTPGYIGVTLLAIAVGGFMLTIPGAVLGLCLGIIVWTADAIQADV